LRLKDKVDAAPGKLRSLVKKFLDELFLKRLRPLIKFDMGHKVSGGSNGAPSLGTRSWPESQKDQTIKEIMEVRRKQEEEEQKKRDEEAKRQAELDAQARAAEAALQSPEAIIEREQTALRAKENDTAVKAASVATQLRVPPKKTTRMRRKMSMTWKMTSLCTDHCCSD